MWVTSSIASRTCVNQRSENSGVSSISFGEYKFNSDYIFTRMGTCRSFCSVPLRYNARQFGSIFMAALRSRCGHYIFALWFLLLLLSSFFLSSPNLSRRRLDVYHPNFAALNRGRHLYSAGRPSRWALAHILVFCGGTPLSENACANCLKIAS